MENVIVDIGVIVEYLKSGEGQLPEVYEKYKMHIASSTFSELLASSTFSDEALETEVREFVKKYFEVVPVSEEMALAAAHLMREHDLTIAAANVAAAAKTLKAKLVTDDVKLFEKIDGVEILKTS